MPAKHRHAARAKIFALSNFCTTLASKRPWNRNGTRVAAAQHLLEKPAFAELRHCAATPSPEQSTRGVPFRARLFGQDCLVRLFGEDEVQQNRLEAGDHE
ncbi:hypothetical protein ACVWZV_006405 [Bradyrhizobium sp. GM5.1]